MSETSDIAILPSPGESRQVSTNSGGRVLAFAKLARPGNVFIVFCGVVVGSVLALQGGSLRFEFVDHVWLAALSAMLIAAGANAANDVFDVPTDAVNRPNRPLPSGALATTHAAAAAFGLTIVGLGLSIAVSLLHFQIAIAVAVAMLSYNMWLKRVPLLGNIVVSSCVAATLAYGAMTIGSIEPVLDACVFAFLTTLARELIKDIEDLTGDRAAGLKTFPSVVGVPATIGFAIVLLFLTLALLPVPYIIRGHSGLYLIFGAVASVFLVKSSWALVRNPSADDLRNASRSLKVGMVFGLLALLFAHVSE